MEIWKNVVGYEADAELKLFINHSSITKVCKNKQKSAKGYVFRYAM